MITCACLMHSIADEQYVRYCVWLHVYVPTAQSLHPVPPILLNISIIINTLCPSYTYSLKWKQSRFSVEKALYYHFRFPKKFLHLHCKSTQLIMLKNWLVQEKWIWDVRFSHFNPCKCSIFLFLLVCVGVKMEPVKKKLYLRIIFCHT